MNCINGMLRATMVVLAVAAAGAAAQPAVSAPKWFPWDHRPSKCLFAGMPLEAFGCAPPVDWPDYPETVSRVGDLFIEPDFELVARAERDLAYSDQRFASGDYHFDAWYAGLQRLFEYQPERGRRAVEKWRSLLGSDGSVALAEALILYGEAWEARGPGKANTVSPEGWKLYRANLEKSLAVLDQAPPKIKAIPTWSALRLGILLQQSDKRQAALEEFRNSSARWPLYRRLYSIAATYSFPRWGGDFDAVEGIARLALEQTRAEQGTAMYAWFYATQVAADHVHTVRDTQVDWPLMKQGIRDIVDRGTSSIGLLVLLAKAACQMEDRDEARRLYAIIDERAKPGENTSKGTDSCRAYAAAK